jgi:hypothetical protein
MPRQPSNVVRAGEDIGLDELLRMVRVYAQRNTVYDDIAPVFWQHPSQRVYTTCPPSITLDNTASSEPIMPQAPSPAATSTPSTTQYPASTIYAISGRLARREQSRFNEAAIRAETARFWAPTEALALPDRINKVYKVLVENWGRSDAVVQLAGAIMGVDFVDIITRMDPPTHIYTTIPIVVVPISNSRRDVELNVPHITYGQDSAYLIRRNGSRVQHTCDASSSRSSYRAPTEAEIQYMVDSVCNAPTECWVG